VSMLSWNIVLRSLLEVIPVRRINGVVWYSAGRPCEGEGRSLSRLTEW
jgi:hypothetical protein